MAVIPGQAVTAYPLPDEELSPTSKNAVSNEAVCEGLNEIKNTLNHKADVIYDIASGDIASFPDGADGLPVKDLTVAIEPVQSGTGDPSPTNVRPISGWTGCNISHSGADTSDPTVIPITFPSEAGTVYGGTLDVTSGVLTVTHKGVRVPTDYSAAGWLVNFNTTRVRYTVPDMATRRMDNAYKDKCVLCNRYKKANSVSTAGPFMTQSRSEDANPVSFLVFYNHGFSTLDDWQNYIANNEVFVTYMLAESLVIPLDHVAVTTLLGQNNVWADCGPVSVEYPADTKLYIQKINAPTDDDMIADANIASGKYFIVNNNLYLSTAAIRAGDPIKPGTNCTLTNLAAALNAINT